jgi:recombinational DNA repair protein (RecF pathway)
MKKCYLCGHEGNDVQYDENTNHFLCKRCLKQMEKVDFWMYIGLCGFLILLIWLLIW